MEKGLLSRLGKLVYSERFVKLHHCEIKILLTVYNIFFEIFVNTIDKWKILAKIVISTQGYRVLKRKYFLK